MNGFLITPLLSALSSQQSLSKVLTPFANTLFLEFHQLCCYHSQFAALVLIQLIVCHLIALMQRAMVQSLLFYFVMAAVFLLFYFAMVVVLSLLFYSAMAAVL